MKNIIYALAAALSVAACDPPPRQECTSSHVEEASQTDVAAVYMFTGSKLAAAAAAEDRIICDKWEAVR